PLLRQNSHNMVVFDFRKFWFTIRQPRPGKAESPIAALGHHPLPNTIKKNENAKRKNRKYSA
ncbi:MAG TPA: hypothetical protein VNU70_05705, partial [Puia sp.]|nr:hypothetical protein [Puia sp.]